MQVGGGVELKLDMKNESFVGPWTCPLPETRGCARRALHRVRPISLDLLMAATAGAPPLCQALCNALCVHWFIKSTPQSSYYFHPHSTDEESEAQGGKVSPETTEPVNGSTGMQTPFPKPRYSHLQRCQGEAGREHASSIPGGPTALRTGKWPTRPVLGVSFSIPGKKVKYLRGAH